MPDKGDSMNLTNKDLDQQLLGLAKQGKVGDFNALREANPDHRVDFREADLRDADLTDADLRDADLTCANLICVNLTRANLTDAELGGTTLFGAIGAIESGTLQRKQREEREACEEADRKVARNG